MIAFKERCDVELQRAPLDVNRHIAQHGASAEPRITPTGIRRDRPDIVRAAGKQQPADVYVVWAEADCITNSAETPNKILCKQFFFMNLHFKILFVE